MFSFHLCWRSVSVIICLLFFAGCAPTPRGGTPLGAIDQALEQPEPLPVEAATPPPPLPPEIRSALIPSLAPLSAVPVEEAERFDIAASQVPAREFFMSVVEGSSFNMVVHPEVSGEISVDLKNTTVEEVLQVIHNVYGYSYFKTGNIYQVMPIGLQTQTFQVNYLNLVRNGSSQIQVTSGQITNSSSGSDGDNGNSRGSREKDSETITGSSIKTESKSDFWSELRVAIQILIGNEGGRKVVVQPQASIVVVVAMPDELQMVEKYLQIIERNLQRQVVIEAKIIEVSLSDGFQSGINWAAMSTNSDGHGVLAGQVGGGRIFNDKSSSFTDNLLGDKVPTGLKPLAFGGVFGMALNFNDFKAFIELLETQGDVQVLSSPRISTTNNQKAVIKVGHDEYFVTDISSDTYGGDNTSNNSTDLTLTPFFSGVALDVTPQIDANGGMTLHVHPSVSEVQDKTKLISLRGEVQGIPLAYSTVRETDSVVHAESGQLIIIGGLMKNNIINEDAGVPILKDLPIIGSLFQHSRSSSRKSELVILLRPQIINSPGDWATAIEASRRRIEKMSPQFKSDWRQY